MGNRPRKFIRHTRQYDDHVWRHKRSSANPSTSLCCCDCIL